MKETKEKKMVRSDRHGNHWPGEKSGGFEGKNPPKKLETSGKKVLAVKKIFFHLKKVSECGIFSCSLGSFLLLPVS